MNSSLTPPPDREGGREKPAGPPTIENVDALLTGLAAVVGVLVGAAAALAFRASEREQRVPSHEIPTPALPQGAADVLALLRSSTVVLDGEDRVVRSSPAAYSFGLVREQRLLSEELLELVRQVRRDGQLVLRHPLGLLTGTERQGCGGADQDADDSREACQQRVHGSDGRWGQAVAGTTLPGRARR